ncbi:hypothetical protein TCAL_02039 [Tigriopus californicus]|uniref:SET domain-containing protein n=1 Tax=Tigriopus californicus TaxID=6832 RepID=A0A553NEG2_TIGCA|nr:histone-lysine N-methyltransferase SETD7-like [Tigriopus californicus]TRY63830.1 hypothetical protein TCAL_02039 [Tigriopus californicus]|eukprot:TCALIF_02039-PA protein Name:"Similar to SETD7 Histone-lysine N-methyltransferase SETD7 (Homo sapiens)" AED:0.09 eAED:0.12 QI:0/-1/0/1/-1/1/1/0/428
MWNDFSEWIRRAQDPSALFLQELQSEDEGSSGKRVNPKRIDRGLRPLGFSSELNVENQVNYEDGSSFHGDVILGTPFGLGTFQKSDGTLYEGYFHEGCPDGLVKISSNENHFEEAYFKLGHNLGIYRRLSMDNRLEFRVKQKRHFFELVRFEGGGILMGPTASNRSRIFIYPDQRTAIVGQFDDKHRVIKGYYGHVDGFRRSENGLFWPEIRDLKTLTVGFERPNTFSLGTNLLERDLYEKKTCQVGLSKTQDNAGEGLFALRDLRQGDLIAFFNGVRKRRVIRAMPSSANSEDWSDYSITLSRDISLDIPEPMRSIHKYQATLAHKACHSFEPNSAFRRFFHPRFGLIMCIIAIEHIQKEQEILVHYRYPIKSAPSWYQSQWYRYLRYNRGWEPEFIDQFGFVAHDVQETLESLSTRIQSPPSPVFK